MTVNEEDVRGAFCNESKAVELTGLGRVTLYKLRKSGALKFSRIGGRKGGRVVYSLKDLIDFASARKS